LVSAKMSRQSAGSAAGSVISMVGIAEAYKDLGLEGKAPRPSRVARFIAALLCDAPC
jgi:hypothetical protein